MFEISLFLFTFRRFVALPIEIIAENFRIVRSTTLPSQDDHVPFRFAATLSTVSLAPDTSPTLVARLFLAFDVSTPSYDSPFTDLRAVHPPSLPGYPRRSRCFWHSLSVSVSALSKRGWLRPILRIRIRKPQSFERVRGKRREDATSNSFFSICICIYVYIYIYTYTHIYTHIYICFSLAILKLTIVSFIFFVHVSFSTEIYSIGDNVHMANYVSSIAVLNSLCSFAYATRVSIRELTAVSIRTLHGCYNSIIIIIYISEGERTFILGMFWTRSVKT